MRLVTLLTTIATFATLTHFANAQDASNEVVAEPLVAVPAAPCEPLSSRIFYEVKPGDNLVKILKTFKLAPLWCKGCSIQSTAALNKLSNQNFILVNQKIELPFRCEADLASFEVVPRDSERFVTRPGETVRPPRETASAAPAVASEVVVQAETVPTVENGAVVTESVTIATPVAAPIVEKQTLPAATPAAIPPLLMAPPTVAVTPNESVDTRTSDLRVAGIYGFHSIYGTEVNDGSHASLVSTPAYGFAVDWSIPWSDEWRSNVGLAQRFIQFRKASVGTINDSGNNVGGFSVGVERRWLKTHLHLDVGAEQSLAIRATGSQAIVLDPITVPVAQASIEQVLHKSGPFEFAANLKYRYMGPTKSDSYDVKAGSAYGGGLSLSQQLEKMKIDVRFDYSNEFQNSTIVEHDTKHLEMQIGITIPLGGGSSSLKAPPR